MSQLKRIKNKQFVQQKAVLQKMDENKMVLRTNIGKDSTRQQNKMEETESQNSISNAMTVAGLLNGMVGGTILVLPIIGITTGYITTLAVCLLLGILSYSTAHLIVVHLGKAKTMIECILNHFGQNYSYVVAYALIVVCGQIPTHFMYFNLICLQLQGLIGYQQYIGILVAIILMAKVVVVVYFDFGEQTMGIGIISIIVYVLFIAWALVTSPLGNRQIPPFGNADLLVSALLMAYAIHDFLPQNIVKNPNIQDYRYVVAITFLFGTLIYIFIAEGSFGIVNRLSYKSKPQTVEDYFEMGGVQVTVIEGLYLFHLVTVFPQFLKFSKNRFFNIVKIENHRNLEWRQVVYYATVITACFVVYRLEVSLDALITINGAVFGTFVVIVIPICVHVKCVYFDRNCGSIEGEAPHQTEGSCAYTYSNRGAKNLQLFFLFCVIVFGFYTMFTSVYSQLISNN